MIARTLAGAPVDLPVSGRGPSFVVLSVDALLRSGHTSHQLVKD